MIIFIYVVLDQGRSLSSYNLCFWIVGEEAKVELRQTGLGSSSKLGPNKDMRFTLVGTISSNAITSTYGREHSPCSTTPSCPRPPIQELSIKSMDCFPMKPSLTHQHHDQVGNATRCNPLKDLIPSYSGQDRALEWVVGTLFFMHAHELCLTFYNLTMGVVWKFHF
jgi:hypothetical protein